jgi:hypothetical protein
MSMMRSKEVQRNVHSYSIFQFREIKQKFFGLEGIITPEK